MLVRIKGQAPIAATVYELEKLRCHLCGKVFTAAAPEGAGEKKYDESAAAMMALLRYGSGFPWNRLEEPGREPGHPVAGGHAVPDHGGNGGPTSTRARGTDAPGGARRSGAQRRYFHARVVAGPGCGPFPERTGVFTSGIVWVAGEHRIALYLHRLQTRRRESGGGAETAACRASATHSNVRCAVEECAETQRHADGELQCSRTAATCGGDGDFPEECRFVLETLGEVFSYDDQARVRALSPEERLHFHQEHSGPLMEKLHEWIECPVRGTEDRTELRAGQAISYLLNHWEKLTLFLRVAGAPIDNNIVERSLKKAILNRRNALFYKTRNGAQSAICS